jgi:hypothetical protein
MNASRTDRFAVVKPGRTYLGKQVHYLWRRRVQGDGGRREDLHERDADVARALAMLRNKHVEMPGRKHDNLPV